MTIDIGVKGAIITGGLGRPACKGIITILPFQVFGDTVFKVLGGSIPLAPGEIQNFYKPVDDKVHIPDSEESTESNGEFVDSSVYGKRVVGVKITSEFFKGEKQFIIPVNRAKVIFKVANIINSTMKKMQVTVNNLKNIAARTKVYIKNLRKHK